MKTMRERLEYLGKLEYRERSALQAICSDKVRWADARTLPTVGGMPPKFIKVGMMQTRDPFVIVYYVDTGEVAVLTPDQAAMWPWPTVQKVDGLEPFLRKYARVETEPNIHTPGDSWIRKARNGASRLAEVREYVASHNDDDEMDDGDLARIFRLAYDREPDDADRASGIWSLICAAVR